MIPVSLSDGIEPGARTGTSLGGQAVVLWRGRDGSLRAWADRCPHRGMRLSFGYVRDNALTCIYHGWSFGGDGRCLSVPAHPGLEPPAKASVPALPVTEAAGLVWVGADPGDTAPPLDAVPDAGALYPVRSVTVHAPLPALRGALAETPPPGTDATEVSEAADGLITFKGPAVRVVAALQGRGQDSSSAHIVTTDPGTAHRKALCLWAALVRDHLAAAVLP